MDTGVLPADMAVIDFNDPQTQVEWRDRVTKEGDGRRLPPPPFDPATAPADLAGLSDDHLTRLRTLATPQPFATVTGTLDRPAPPMEAPSTIIACTFTPAQARTLAATGDPVFAPMARMDLRHLPTGHWPMLSRPADLAALLDEVASGRRLLGGGGGEGG
ncbi:hypothetical protein ACH4PU_25770 [Streptomyces sp. NPDC021100]|uniref:hypothetical protein n=1 Tax=Streptomyces sp. NPDC021100 TaxID=3365114 RepID=UPI0037A4DB81